MKQRERELIAALAEGSLQDETEARALLESSGEAQAEYRLHLAALNALSTVEPATLLEDERADLHRVLWTSLRAEGAKSRSTSGIYGWSLAAAALFVIVGLAAVLGGGMLNLAQSGDEAAESFQEIASDLAGDTDTTAAAAEALETPAAGEESRLSPTTEEYLAQQADRLRSGEFTQRHAEDDLGRDRDCLAEARLADHEIAAVINDDGSAPIDGRYLAAIPAGETIGPDTTIHFVDSVSCELVYTDR